MKKLVILLVLLFLPIMTGCKTTEKIIQVKYVLPPKPQRKEIQAPQTIQDYAQILNYYEHLVQEWELWGATVTECLTNDEK